MVTRCTSWAYVAAVLLLTGVSTATAKYSGGTGEPNDPYQIATAADLIALGEDANDYDKHFILTADIDLAGYIFDKAVIAPDVYETNEWWTFDGTPFTGVFDGNGHTISHLTINGVGYLGPFGQMSGEVQYIGIVDVNIIGSGGCVGGLVGINWGTVTNCYSNGVVSGEKCVGGLVGSNVGTVTDCHSGCSVTGSRQIGGLVGSSVGNYSTVANCCSTGAVRGSLRVGGLVGVNGAIVTHSYSTGAVTGGELYVGGLVGYNYGPLTDSYSTGAVHGAECVGGLVGSGVSVTNCYSRGVVSGNQYVGGLAGYIEYGTVTSTTTLRKLKKT